MNEEYFNRVVKISEVKYDIDRDILENFKDKIEECYKQNYTVRRTVEVIANILFE